MRLLHTTFMTLSEFIGDSTPEYAILSHTWGEEEVLFLDIINRKGNGKAGYAKLEGCCKKARDDGFEWVWIDTCCINKDSSAELSEAINSMFLWYKSATVCYAYLADISTSEAGLSDSEALRLTQSRWFSRGWTLQELIAPPLVEFYSQEWVDIGTKTSLWLLISQKTGIPKDVLLTGNLSDCNAAAKMSWAASRVTTRSEDMAYCLLGIFDINMPMLYGEGDKAFARLQREIIIQEIDYSIFVWSGLEHQNKMGVLASSPSNFTLPLDLYDFHSSLPDHTSCILDYNDLVVVDPSGQELYKSAKEVVEPPMFTPRGLKMT
ncbi:heterokaryon incompatibility protein-domain-containing protein, partial [Dendryphion nanum]